MRHNFSAYYKSSKWLTSFIVMLAFPLIVITVLTKYLLLSIAIVTPAPWTKEEEAILKRAIWNGEHASDLKFSLWRRESDIKAKAKELGLL